MSLRFICVVLISSLLVTLFFFFTDDLLEYTDFTELLLINLLYQIDFCFYFIYVLLKYRPFKNRQAFILLSIYFLFIVIGTFPLFYNVEAQWTFYYIVCESFIRILFIAYFFFFLKLNFLSKKIYLFISLGVLLTSSIILYSLIIQFPTKTFGFNSILFFVISAYLIVGSGVDIKKIRNKAFLTVGVILTFISDFSTLLQIYLEIDEFTYTFLRLISSTGEFLLIYTILEELKATIIIKKAIRH